MTQEKNMKMYNQTKPPIIHLENISENVPISLYVGKNDTVATTRDAKWLVKLLGPSKVISYTELENFGHSNFMWGIDKSVYDQIAIQLNQYNYLDDKV